MQGYSFEHLLDTLFLRPHSHANNAEGFLRTRFHLCTVSVIIVGLEKILGEKRKMELAAECALILLFIVKLRIFVCLAQSCAVEDTALV